MTMAVSRMKYSMLVQLELMEYFTPKNLEDIVIDLVKTKFGDELTGWVVKILASESDLVQQLQEESSSDKITREAPTINSLSLPNGSVYQPLLGTDITDNCGQPHPQQKQQMEAHCDSSYTNIVNSQPCSDDCDDDFTTTYCQPGENDIHMPWSHTSVHTKGDEQMNVLGPVYCEGLSGAVDDYSGCVDSIHCYIPSIPQPSDCVDLINYCMPSSPQPILVEVSPLVMEDMDMPLSFHTNTSNSSGPYVVCHSEVAAAASMVLVVENKEQIFIP